MLDSCVLADPGSGLDGVDTDHGVRLAMSLAATVVLAPAHLEDVDLVAAAFADDGGLDCRVLEQGLADGMYFLQIVSGEETISQRFLVRK